MIDAVSVGGRLVGPAQPCFVIAEAGVNHNGDLELARRLVDVAVDAAADAVKFQSFVAERLASEAAPKAGYQLEATDAAESQREMIRRLELTFEQQRALYDYCQQRGIVFLSTPFDEESADFLLDLGVPAFKIGSGDVTNWPLVRHVAGMGRPVILSTGMSTLAEVDEVLRVIHGAGNSQVVLLHCVSNYPAEAGTANLRAMQSMAAAFQVPVGYSDHTLGVEVCLAAVAMGACVIEKHVTLDRNMKGPDHAASADPQQLRALVNGIRIVESAFGDGFKRPAGSELGTAAVARRSLVAAQAIPSGTVITERMVRILRPGTGLPPNMLPFVVGRTARREIPAGTVITLEMLV